MATLQELSEKLFKGEVTTHDPQHHPFAALNQLEELASGIAFYKGFVNITGVRTDEGLVLVDTGGHNPRMHTPSFEALRDWNRDRLHTAIYTHGHVDHAYGLPPFLRQAEAEAWPRPQIVGHVEVAPRMQRYIETAGYNSVINTRQFGIRVEWPIEAERPTVTYRETLSLRVGGRRLELTHARGETDDHTWVFIPDSRVLCTGDLFIWASPNAGNPQKVQRYAIEWARALRQRAALEPELLLPGHGVPVFGAARVREALVDTAEYLESLYRQTVELMNQGATVYELIESVKAPGALADKPYLQPTYDEPEFIVRNVFRCLGGWYTGVPSELKPAPRGAQAREIAELAGGVGKLLERASDYLGRGDLRMASHLADWAADAEPESSEVHRVRAEVYARRAKAETSTMSKGIFGAAARESSERAGD